MWRHAQREADESDRQNAGFFAAVVERNSTFPRQSGGLQGYRGQKIQTMKTNRITETDPKLKTDDLIVITGAGGFIGGNLVKYFDDRGHTRIRAADKKPLREWYQRVPGVESLYLD